MADSAIVQLTMNIDLVDSSQIRLAALIVEAVRTSKHDWHLSGDVDAVARCADRRPGREPTRSNATFTPRKDR